MEKDTMLFGTKIINSKNNEKGILIYTYDNKFADGTILYACCINPDGKKYYIEFDELINDEFGE